MSEPVPLRYGMYYHVFNRGNNRENVFFEQRNYRHFLRLYARYVEPIVDTYAYCLLPNHFHLLARIKTPQEQSLGLLGESSSGMSEKALKPSQQFSNLFNAYAKAINKARERTGSLFEHPFRRIAVTSDAHFSQLVLYIHRNPEKHGLVDDFRSWPYSSYHALLSSRPTRLQREQVLAWFGGPEHLVAWHKHALVEDQITPLLLDDFD